jgi:hypothetical protein
VVERVDPDAFSLEELPFGEVDVPDAAAGPADLLPGLDVLSVGDGRRDVPVSEMADVEPPVKARLGHRGGVHARGSRPDCVDAMGEQRRGARLGVAVVDADVDPEVVAREAGVVPAARIEERAADGVLGMFRVDRPAVVAVLVDVVEVRGERAGNAAIDGTRGRRGERHRGGSRV